MALRIFSNRPFVFVAVLACLLASIIPAYRDYELYMSYGPGGVPYNAFGWLQSRFLGLPFAQEMLGTEEYQQSIECCNPTTFILPDAKLPRRKGTIPKVGPHPIPQRQINQFPDDRMKESLRNAFDAFAAKNSHLVHMATSAFERHTDAMWLTDAVPLSSRPPEALDIRGEVAHVHGTSDHSLHLLLSPADAKEVIEAGWGQRHAFSGSKLLAWFTRGRIALPPSYLLIYAPRDNAEIEVVMEIVRASLRFMSGGADLSP